MVSDILLLWSYLNVLTKVRYTAIKDVYGGLPEASKHLGEELLRSLGLREEALQKALLRLEEFDPKSYRKAVLSRGLSLLTLDDDAYPPRLKEIGDPPVFLYAKGDLTVLDQPTIALVGTRQMSAYGRRVTQAFVPDFVAAGMVTISGLAMGIDAEVARETLKAGGKTVAALGHGLGMIYPQSNAALAEEIVSQGGLLLSEFPLDMPPDTYTFPARNRVIAGLSLGTVVLEAPEGSGALITADLALDYGRDVFAVPGQIFDTHYAGCHAFIASGRAKLTRSAKDVLEEIGIVSPAETSQHVYAAKNPEEEALLKALTTMPQPMDDLVERSGLNAGKISAALTMMELHGAVKNVGGGMWVRN